MQAPHSGSPAWFGAVDVVCSSGFFHPLMACKSTRLRLPALSMPERGKAAVQQQAMGLATRQDNPSGKQRGMKTCKAKARPPCAASEPCAAVQQAMFFPCLQKAPPCPGHFGPFRRLPWAWLADRWVDTSQRPQQARHRRQFYGKNRLQCRLDLRCKLFFQ